MKGGSEILLCQFYKLDTTSEEHKWVYLDVGYAHFNPKNELVILQKETSQEIHKHQILKSLEYSFDDQEAISFKTDNDYALSFQSKAGAEAVWDQIQKILQKEDKEDSDDDDLKLTPVNERTLPDILDLMNQVVQMGQHTKQVLLNYLLNKKAYLEKLQTLFSQLEKDGNLKLLTIMCSVVKNIVTVADHELFQIIMSDQFYQFIFGALEYDEEMSKKDFVPHRQFLEKQCQFIQVVPIKSKDRMKCIHFIYRLYLLHRRMLVDTYQDSLNIIKSHYNDLLNYIQNSKEFLIEVIDQFRNFNYQALRLITEICNIFKEYPDLNKQIIYQKLSEYGLYDIIEEYINDSLKNYDKYKAKLKKQKVKISDDTLSKTTNMILELVIVCLQHAPFYFRGYVINEHQQVLKYPLFHIVVDNAFTNELYMEILKLLIENNPDEQNDTLDLFLIQFLPKISSSITHLSTKETKIQFVELCLGLAKAIKPQIKEAFILNQIASKIGFILQENSKIEQMKCLQVIKYLVLSRDEDINQELMKALPNLIVVVISYKKVRENLIFSQILEIVKFIYEGVSQKLIQSLEEELKKEEVNQNYARIYDIFKNLKTNCLKQQFSQQAPDTKTQPQTIKTNYNIVDDEMDLFKSVQGHNNVNNIKQKKLVDYEDELDSPQKKIKLE